LTALTPALYSPQNKKTTDATDDAEVKKMSLIMVSNEKILKQKNSLRSGINISIWLVLAVLAVALGLTFGFGGTFSAVAGIYLGYKLLKLILRLAGLVLTMFLYLISILAIILTISFLIS
jgi:hypothetical protein